MRKMNISENYNLTSVKSIGVPTMASETNVVKLGLDFNVEMEGKNLEY